jgi:hypothetical protein
VRLLALEPSSAPLDAGGDIDATTIISSSLTWRPVNIDGADLRKGISGGPDGADLP